MIAINKSNYKLVWKGLKISELCKMIESSIRSGKYPLEDQKQKAFANSVEDSFRMLCRRLGRVTADTDGDNYSKSITISEDKLHSPRSQAS